MMTIEEIQANKEIEEKRQNDRRERICQMKNLEASNSMNFEEETMKGEMNVDDANVEMVNMEDNANVETNPTMSSTSTLNDMETTLMQTTSGMFSNPPPNDIENAPIQTTYLGMSSNPSLDNIDFSYLIDEVGYTVDDVSNLNLKTMQKQNNDDIPYMNANEIEIPRIDENVNEIPFMFENENETPCVSENETPCMNKNETPCVNENVFFIIERDVINNLPGKVSWRQMRTHANKVYKMFFYRKKLGFQCQFIMQLMKMSKIRKVMKKLGIFVKPKKKDDSVEQVISSVANAIESIGKKSQSKDKNVARLAITTALVNKSTPNKRMLSKISKYIKLNPKTLIRATKRRESIEKDPINHCWSFSGRLPRSDMKLTNKIKYLIEKYWHDNRRVSPNIRDVLKLRVGSKIHEPHPKHLLDMTQTELYKKFLDDSILPFNITISQRSFEKCKPWYVRINKQ